MSKLYRDLNYDTDWVVQPSDIASEYSATASYSVGQLCVRDGAIKICSVAGTGPSASFSDATVDTALEGKAAKADVRFEAGSGADSAVQKQSYTDPVTPGENNSALSAGSVAEGTSNYAGLKGYRYTNAVGTTITNTLTFDTAPVGWAAGDVVSVINDAKYPDAGTIQSISGNTVTFAANLDVGGTVKADDGWDARCAYVSAKPNSGNFDLGYGAHAEGVGSKALNVAAHAEGRETQALGQYAHAEGRGTTAQYAAHAEGNGSKALGQSSHAEGIKTEAKNNYEHAEGCLNASHTGPLEKDKTRHSIGIGPDAEHRKNAVEVMVSGDAYLLNVGGYDGTNPGSSNSVQTVIKGVTDWFAGGSLAAGTDSSTGYRGVALGYKASTGENNTGNTGAVAIGNQAKALAEGACQIGWSSAANTVANTLRFHNTTIVNENGKIVSANLDKEFATKSELDEKQDKLTFDDTPTAGSDNPVKSNGIKSELSTLGARITAEQTTRATNDKARINSASVAPDFSAKTYVVGDLVTYESVLYRCKSGYTATASSAKPSSDTTHWESTGINVASLLDGKVSKSGDTITGPLNFGDAFLDPSDGTICYGGTLIKLEEMSLWDPNSGSASAKRWTMEVTRDGTHGVEDIATLNDIAELNDSLGTAALRDVPASGDASSTEVVLGSDTRLTAFSTWKTANPVVLGAVDVDTSKPSGGVIIGSGAKIGGANYSNSIAIGNAAKANALGSIAVGSDIAVSGQGSAQLGHSSTALTAQNTFRFRDTVVVNGNGKIPSENLDKAFVDKTGDTMSGGLTVPNLTVGSRAAGPVGENSVAEGYNTTASGYASHAEGNYTIASGGPSHAEGGGSTASGSCSHAEGSDTSASGYASHAEGGGTASGDFSHAEGSATASGNYSHAEGSATARGHFSHAEGVGSTASGNCSHAEGFGTIAQNEDEHAQGAHNASHTGATDSEKTIHSIGVGTSGNARANAVEVMRDGKVFIKGVGNYDGTNPTGTQSPATDLATVINSVGGQITAALQDLARNGIVVDGRRYRLVPDAPENLTQLAQSAGVQSVSDNTTMGDIETALGLNDSNTVQDAINAVS